MPVSPVVLKKENIKLPDFYYVVFYPISDIKNGIKYQVAEHSYNMQLRIIELKLYGNGDRRRIVIGLDQGFFEFSKEFDEIIELKKIQERADNKK